MKKEIEQYKKIINSIGLLLSQVLDRQELEEFETRLIKESYVPYEYNKPLKDSLKIINSFWY